MEKKKVVQPLNGRLIREGKEWKIMEKLCNGKY
jgi:hypothetical protein